MRVDTARYMSGDLAVHLRNRCRGVNDPWGRGLDRPPGRGRGSLTPRLRYPSRFPGRQRTPAERRRPSSLQRAEVVVIAPVTLATVTFEYPHFYLPSKLTAPLG